jgi:hypothetical protein
MSKFKFLLPTIKEERIYDDIISGKRSRKNNVMRRHKSESPPNKKTKTFMENLSGSKSARRGGSSKNHKRKTLKNHMRKTKRCKSMV